MTTSATTIFRVEPGHPSYPRVNPRPAGTPSLVRQHDGNGNPASLPPPPLSLGVHVGPTSSYNKNQDQRFFPAAFQSGYPPRQLDLVTGRGYGTPTLARTGSHCRPASSARPAQLHGTMSNRRRQRRAGDADDNQGSDEESARLLLMSGDDVWMKPQVTSSTLGKQPRVSGNQVSMP